MVSETSATTPNDRSGWTGGLWALFPRPLGGKMRRLKIVTTEVISTTLAQFCPSNAPKNYVADQNQRLRNSDLREALAGDANHKQRASADAATSEGSFERRPHN
jgi:hypothetical protein